MLLELGYCMLREIERRNVYALVCCLVLCFQRTGKNHALNKCPALSVHMHTPQAVKSAH